MTENTDLKRTPLFPVYERYGGRLVPFSGWEMPVQFSGIIDEHRAVRTGAGLFDASHMGQVWIRGRRSLDAVQLLTTNDAAGLHSGCVQYSAMANLEGGVIDDLTVYCVSPEQYMLCVNAGNAAKDLRWITAHLEGMPGVEVADESEATVLLALQGPKSQAILSRLTYADLQRLSYYHFIKGDVAGIGTMISRTGYTGEDGFELYVESDRGVDLWEEIMAVGEEEGLKCCGLGARDTLRLEMGYLLHGADMDETVTPLEAGLGWITKTGKGDFLGRAAILRQQEEGPTRRLAAFVMEERGIPRQGCRLLHDGTTVGRVTSGTHSPTLGIGIGLGWLPRELTPPGTPLAVSVRERELRASVVKPPFHRSGSIRR